MGVLGYGKPIIFIQQVIISKDKNITIRYWFGEGYTEKISKALYEIILTRDNEIRSYRFKIQNKLFQVSPSVYERGEDLSEILEPFVIQKELRFRPGILG